MRSTNPFSSDDDNDSDGDDAAVEQFSASKPQTTCWDCSDRSDILSGKPYEVHFERFN